MVTSAVHNVLARATSFGLVVAGGAVVLEGLALTTYREWADGSLGRLALAALLGLTGVLALVVWSERRTARQCVALVPVVLLLFPVPVAHTIRLVHRHEALERPLRTIAAYREVLTPTLHGDAKLSFGPDELVLRAPPASIGYFDVRTTFDPGERWDLPRALLAPGHPRLAETLLWRSSIDLERAYFTLVDVDQVIFQVTSWGLLITAPDQTGRPSAQSVSLPHQQGAWMDWNLVNHAGRLSLRAGDRELWSAPHSGPFKSVRLGETRSDQEHGGTMRLSQVRLTRSLV